MTAFQLLISNVAALRIMLFRYTAILFITLLSCLSPEATGSSLIEGPEDTLVVVKGKAFDNVSKKPIAATIFYEKLPYGNDLGIVHTDKNSGCFEFMLFPSADYKIYVKAPGYVAVVDRLGPPDAEDNLVSRDYYLKPIRQGETIRLEKLIFEQGKFRLQEESYEELDVVALMLNENPSMVVQLEGHTDFRGNKKLNLKLSKQRVKVVRDYLTSLGIRKKRIKIKALGGQNPVTYENSEEARRINRRVEIRILKL